MQIAGSPGNLRDRLPGLAALGDEVAVEVKATANVTDRHLTGITALQEEKLLKRHVVVCQETRRRVVDGIEILPWRAFADELWSDHLVRG